MTKQQGENMIWDKISELPFQKLVPKAILPTRAHEDDAGLDLYSSEDVLIEPSEGKMIATGVASAIPRGYFGLIGDRSSLGKRGLKTMGGIVDAGYRGEIKVILWNNSEKAHHLKSGERIAQLMILPIATPKAKWVDSLDSTARGEGGFGSTGA